MKKFVISLFCASLFANNFCQTLDQSAATLTIGEGEIKSFGTGVGTNREDALKMAYEDAINNAIGVFVSSATVIENDQLIKDEIISLSRGFIKAYKIIDEKSEKNQYNISIVALVIEKQIYQTLKAKGVEVKYNASSMFAQIENYDKEADKELQFVSSYLEHLKLLEYGSIFDFDLEVGEPIFRDNGMYQIPLTINVKPNQNYGNIKKQVESLLSEIAYETILIKPSSIKSNEYSVYRTAEHPSNTQIRTLDNVEVNRLKKEGWSVNINSEYLDIFQKEFSPYIIVVETSKGYLFHKFLNTKSIDLIKHFSNYIFSKDTLVIKANFTNGENLYGIYNYKDRIDNRATIQWTTYNPFHVYYTSRITNTSSGGELPWDYLHYSPYYPDLSYDNARNNSGFLASDKEETIWWKIGIDRSNVSYSILYEGILFWINLQGKYQMNTSLQLDEGALKKVEKFEINHKDQTEFPKQEPKPGVEK